MPACKYKLVMKYLNNLTSMFNSLIYISGFRIKILILKISLLDVWAVKGKKVASNFIVTCTLRNRYNVHNLFGSILNLIQPR